MTCIAGIAAHGRVLLGADSMYAEGDDVIVSSDPKVWSAGGWVVGAAGTVAWMDILRAMRWPATPREGVEIAARAELPQELRRVAGATGADLSETPGVALVGCFGHMYLIDSDLVVVRATEGFAAVGSGRQPAMGALYATRRKHLTPRTRIRTALEAAERYTASVRRPWRWVST